MDYGSDLEEPKSHVHDTVKLGSREPEREWQRKGSEQSLCYGPNNYEIDQPSDKSVRPFCDGKFLCPAPIEGSTARPEYVLQGFPFSCQRCSGETFYIENKRQQIIVKTRTRDSCDQFEPNIADYRSSCFDPEHLRHPWLVYCKDDLLRATAS